MRPWEVLEKERVEKQKAERTQMEIKGWVPKPGQVDPNTSRFHQKLQAVITEEILSKIEKIPEMHINIGPYSHNFNNTTNSGNIIAILTLDQSLEICWQCGPRIANNGFRIKGVRECLTLDGVVGYINEKWLPKVKKKIKSLNVRGDLSKEIEESIKTLNHRKFLHKDLSKLLRSVFGGAYGTGYRYHDLTEHYIISDSKGFKAIEDFKDDTYRYVAAAHSKTIGNILDLRLICISIRKDKHQIQIAHCIGEDTNKHYLNAKVNKTKWGSPKSLMAQLAEHSRSNPAVAALLANPEVGKL